MPRFTRRSAANAANDNTRASSFDPLLSLQRSTEIDVLSPSPEIQNPREQSGRNKRTYSSYEASNSHTTPATPASTAKTAPTAKRACKRGPNYDHQDIGGSSKENRGVNSGRDGRKEHRNNGIDGIDEVATGRRASYLSDRGDTHHTHRASTVLVEHNLFGIDDGESEIEDEGDWHDDITSKETTCQATKRFEAMAVERASWQADSISSGPGSQNTHQSGDTLDDADDITSDIASSGVAHTATVTPQWPADTDIIFSHGRNRIGLMNQQTIVRLVLQDAIENVHAFLVFRHAFPDPTVTVACTRAALVKSARARFPGGAGIHARLVADEEYFLNMSVVPRARIPIIRNGIKERCSAMVAAEYMALDPLIKIVDLVAKEKDNYNYIYPVAKVGVSVNDRLLKRSQPYRNERIINVIRSVYFTGGASSFMRRFDHLFPRYRDGQGVMKTEVPDAMVALVATAVYSAICDWRSGEKDAIDFTTGAHIDVYDGNVNTLKNMRLQHPNKYHTMMADIYAKVSSTVGSTTAVPIADIPIAELDG